ncbi:MAG TPA: glycosyltransferase [Gemmatimonadales bacterium]
MTPTTPAALDLSVVVPLFNEAGNVARLCGTLTASLERNPCVRSFQLVLVNDGSTDNTLDLLRRHRSERTTIVSLARRHGQSGALAAGVDASTFETVARLDGDLQTTPDDLVPLLELMQRGYDCVHGIRLERKDTWVRRASSRIANMVRRAVLGDTFQDISCPLSVFHKSCLANVPRIEVLHRYLPYLIQVQGYTVAEFPVRHFPRVAERTKYGISNRLWVGVKSLLDVKRLSHDLRRKAA